ncbi:2Fe-2S iron-sulfur cluster-binding protein [Marinomonas pollencensis]|uniref:2Fe-2S ferredoxin n=1 Tax=Marinomonas pollencensis TaxID=491954 RepID=A0A3E0DLY8_9GAMM|nr:2Fe-2S iron-sulfur cluster-binding protein [Marinomonas pollencensis]REG83677.1 2Fe-2S ferredoxin [Marinomonas pollencensis]
MATITYIEHSGETHKIHVENGKTLMQGAVDNLIEGILGDCGGCCNCATCHVMVDDAWVSKTGSPSEQESELLDAVPEPTETSRLGCQIIVSDDLDGLIVRLPEEQF